jgi:hypothetical protein
VSIYVNYDFVRDVNGCTGTHTHTHTHEYVVVLEEVMVVGSHTHIINIYRSRMSSTSISSVVLLRVVVCRRVL